MNDYADFLIGLNGIKLGELDDRITLVKDGLKQDLADSEAAPDFLPGGKRELRCPRISIAECLAALEQMQAALTSVRHLALHDGLTSLPNERYFRQTVDEVLANASSQAPALALLYVDLDGFKSINDVHGHEVGDEVLRIVAARLAATVRSGDMVSRRGGDEFACLLANLPGRDQLEHLARKMYDTVSAPLNLGRFQLCVYLSIGIAVFPTHGVSSSELLSNADAAMYRAKQHRVGYAFCEPP